MIFQMRPRAAAGQGRGAMLPPGWNWVIDDRAPALFLAVWNGELASTERLYLDDVAGAAMRLAADAWRLSEWER
jgi:hypothetical protein